MDANPRSRLKKTVAATDLVPRTLELARELRDGWSASRPTAALLRRRAAVEVATGAAHTPEQMQDWTAQSLAVAAAVMGSAPDCWGRLEVRRWLLDSANPLWREILQDAAWLSGWAESPSGLCPLSPQTRDGWLTQLAALPAPGPADATLQLYESFLARHDRRRRQRHGVYYTPPVVARHIVRAVDRVLREEFAIADGLADTLTWREFAARFPAVAVPPETSGDAPWVSVLDPALGAGVFLLETIDLVHDRLHTRWRLEGCADDEVTRRWTEYVARDLLPRLIGLEILLPACVVAQLRIVEKLHQTGFAFDRTARVEIHWTNSLAGPLLPLELAGAAGDELIAAAARARQAAQAFPFPVVVGNPPFSSLAENQGAWIVDLLKGRVAGRRVASYYEVDGRQLGERKAWLHDDYVKFLRHAHWQIERCGTGVVGLITNHGYLDNITFRGLRQQLLTTFPRIDLWDLHGNRKQHEVAPDGGLDENVFAIDQGTAIGVFRRPPGSVEQSLRRVDLWGPARAKLAALASAVEDEATAAECAATLSQDQSGTLKSCLAMPQAVTPRSPHYRFVVEDAAIDDEYQRGIPLSLAMPVNVSAPVTARDALVVALDRPELLQRLQEFRDLSVPDEAIRARYFTRKRSGKYPPGDSRGWKLSQARRQLAADPRWQDSLRGAWYRPFDRRVIYWSNEMVDWPRNDVMKHLLEGGNLALIARRQMLPTQPCTFFWITDDLALDGIIRSDNRGSESLFPLYVSRDAPGGPQRRANFSAEFLASACGTLGLTWRDEGAGDLSHEFGPEDLAWYCYALFFSPTYRTRYAAGLRVDFPRVFLPRQVDLFRSLRTCGEQLARWHLLKGAPGPAESGDCSETASPGSEWRVASGYPKYSEGRVAVNAACSFAGVAPQIWEFRVGGHAVCRKWLKNRRGRVLSPPDRQTYREIVAGIRQTLTCMVWIDEAIDRHGGWPEAFLTRQGSRPEPGGSAILGS